MSSPKPTAAGSLETTPFAHLLVYALDRSLSGTFVLEGTDGSKSALLFSNGTPVKAKTAEPVVFLGRLLLENGTIDERTHNRTLSRVAQERRRHGEILVEEGALDATELEAALEEQLARQVVWMFTLPADTAYGYYEGVDFLARWGGPSLGVKEPLALLWRGLCARAEPRGVEATLARLGDGKLKLHPAAEPARFGLSAQDRAVIDVLCARPHTAAELMATELVDERKMKLILYALTLTRHLDLGAEPIGIDARGVLPMEPTPRPRMTEPEPAPPRALPAEPPDDAPVGDLEREIRQRAEAKDQSYYDVLGVPADSPPGAISAAYFRLAKRMHPDRLGPEHKGVKDLATKVFARITEAHQILSEAERRAEYDELMKAGGGSADEQEQVQRVLRAATAFQKAGVLLKKQNLAAAETEILRAVEDDPTQGDYIALRAWIISQKPERANAPLEDLIAELGQVIQREPENERARWYRGQLLKRSGKEALAIKDFRWVLDRNPRHLDAAREVRLSEMRKGPTVQRRLTPSGAKKAEQEKKDGGLLNKLFKR